MSAKAQVLAATFTLDELERMMKTAEQAVEKEQQEGALSSAVAPTTAEMVDESLPKKDGPAEPDIPEWMR